MILITLYLLLGALFSLTCTYLTYLKDKKILLENPLRSTVEVFIYLLFWPLAIYTHLTEKKQ